MVLPESKNKVGLGRALMKARNIGAGKAQQGGKGRRRDQGPQQHYAGEVQKEYGSITEQAALDEFLATAELADTDFTAEKLNVKIIHNDQLNPYLLSTEEESKTISTHKAHHNLLKIPRRPHWDDSTTPQALDRMEKESFLNWRRGLAELQENKDLLMTPFERNLEMWRQLWRVIERSDLIVQIVDARNPLLFWCEDVENYVKEVDPRKNNLLLINKADMMTEKQRKIWADYFDKEGIKYTFFSAALAKEQEELEEMEEEDISEGDEEEGEDEDEDEKADGEADLSADTEKLAVKGSNEDEESEDDESQDLKLEDTDPRIQILTADELEEMFLKHAPQINNDDPSNSKRTIGLVGYPNVGKSSTINALIRAKKVSVSSTPGKTKHFQTIHLSPSVILCDCPGLVFPNFATTKAELVCNGILPIDQLREFTGPAGLVARRIPQSFLEAVYGIKIAIRAHEEGGTGIPTAEELLRAYAKARGFTKTGVGEPDESRAARLILKDYVNGKLLYCAPPPADLPIDPTEFNRELYTEEHLPTRRQFGTYHQDDDTASSVDGGAPSSSVAAMPELGERSASVDKQFFGVREGNAGHLKTPFQRPQATHGKQLSGRKARTMFAIENGLTPEEAKRLFSSKKHYKGNRKM